MVESWGKEHILKALQSESLLGLEEKYIEPLLGEKVCCEALTCWPGC